jgi:hypothetical protein
MGNAAINEKVAKRRTAKPSRAGTASGNEHFIELLPSCVKAFLSNNQFLWLGHKDKSGFPLD